jgi:hypothetical protein
MGTEGGHIVLHIVNGDSVGEKLKQADIAGDVFVWREIYTEGPVFIAPEQVQHRMERGQWMEQKLGVPLQDWLQSSEQLQMKLAELIRYEEIVLWFEHDLFDQTMLCRLLHHLSAHPLPSRIKLQLMSIGEYPGIEPFHGFGQLSAAQLAALYGTWHEVDERQLQLGKRAWEAYTASSPEPIILLLQEDLSALPFLRAALLAHLERFPSLYNGLGSVEQAALSLMLAGVADPQKLFQQVSNQLPLLGLGDLQFWTSLRALHEAEQPLLQLSGPVAFPKLNDNPQAFFKQRLVLTELGVQVMAGESDWIVVNGADTWLGGVRLSGLHEIWRRNEQGQLKIV